MSILSKKYENEDNGTVYWEHYFMSISVYDLTENEMAKIQGLLDDIVSVKGQCELSYNKI